MNASGESSALQWSSNCRTDILPQISSNVRRLLVAPPTARLCFDPQGHDSSNVHETIFCWLCRFCSTWERGKWQGAAHFGTLYEFPLSLSGGRGAWWSAAETGARAVAQAQAQSSAEPCSLFMLPHIWSITVLVVVVVVVSVPETRCESL